MIRNLLGLSFRAGFRILPAHVRRKIFDKVANLQIEETPRPPQFEGKMVDSVETVPEHEEQLIPKLLASYKAAKRRQDTVSGPYAPGGGWKALLDQQWRRYNEAITRNDTVAMAAYLRNFFRNEGLSGFWSDEKVFERFREAKSSNLIWRHFAVWNNGAPGASIEALEAPRIGNPWGYRFNGKVLYEPVFEYHLQALYFKRLLSRLQTPVVLEIGGGFGGLAYHLLKAVPGIKYVGFDLPENTLLQTYYLSCAFPRARILAYDEGFTALDRKQLNEYDIVLLPNFALPQVEALFADLIVNVRSLSEMSAETIKEYLKQIDRFGRLFFFHENIFKPRADGFFGIPSCDFPELTNFTLVASHESRWPKYEANSAYPCAENLYLHRRAFG